MFSLEVLALVVLLSGVTLSVPVAENVESGTATQAKKENAAKRIKQLMAQLSNRNGNQQQQKNDESAQKRQWGDPYTADNTANAWSGMTDSGSSSWESCNCWDTSIFYDYGDECYYYCIDYWMYYSPTDYPTDYPTSDYYYGGSDYQTGNTQEEAYWIVEEITWDALNVAWDSIFGWQYDSSWKRAMSQLRRGRRQFQKDGLQQKGKNGEKATNSQDKKDEMTKRHYYGDMTPETKHEAIYWFTYVLDNMIWGMADALDNSAGTGSYDTYWKRAIETIKKKRGGQENLVEKIQQKRSEMQKRNKQ